MVAALAWLPNAPPKVAVDFILVGTVVSVGVNALAIYPVSLTADGMLPSRTPARVLSFCAACCCLHLALFLSLWVLDNLKEIRFFLCPSSFWRMML